MTIPSEIRAFVLGLVDVRRQALAHAETLRADAGSADPAAAVGLRAYAEELEQLAKVQGNYTRRLDQDIGDLDFVAAERKDWETTAEAYERLCLEFEALMNKSRVTALSEDEDARYQELSQGLNRPIAV
ncbi:hypothetical protein [Acidiphilium sp.]|uniref:hypothetical protein n=1 Tax=Acidiphilium sp. TaxID=527 RepID=UPI00258FE9C7|nr:hypothetical protein [Acidiphilium sp.]